MHCRWGRTRKRKHTDSMQRHKTRARNTTAEQQQGCCRHGESNCGLAQEDGDATPPWEPGAREPSVWACAAGACGSRTLAVFPRVGVAPLLISQEMRGGAALAGLCLRVAAATVRLTSWRRVGRRPLPNQADISSQDKAPQTRAMEKGGGPFNWLCPTGVGLGGA